LFSFMNGHFRSVLRDLRDGRSAGWCWLLTVEHHTVQRSGSVRRSRGVYCRLLEAENRRYALDKFNMDILIKYSLIYFLFYLFRAFAHNGNKLNTKINWLKY
jgi:hypothetical protein